VDEVVRLTEVSKIYLQGDQQVHALKDVSLTVGRGEFVAIMGPSGSGKSTCLHILGCLDTPTSGEYLLEGRVSQYFPKMNVQRYETGGSVSYSRGSTFWRGPQRLRMWNSL
jgi:ABC-type lipoprotein export system ATPase subunit